jgi:hypothetical protein
MSLRSLLENEGWILVSHDPYGLDMSKTRRRALKMLICPECGQIGTLRTILYGMPDPETFDFEKYAVGGCCISGDGLDPDVQCNQCEWEGFRDSILV